MGFGVGKLPGANNTHKKRLGKMADRGHTPQEISDRLDVNLTTVLNFFQVHTGKSDEEMEEYSKLDKSSSADRDASAAAKEIIAAAHAEAARITSAATATVLVDNSDKKDKKDKVSKDK